MANLRLFIAFDFSAETVDGIIRIQRELKQGLRTAPIRWVAADTMHVTLQFLGDVDEHKIPALSRAIDDTAREFPPLPVSIRGLGAFPAAQKAQVIWLGIMANELLSALAKTLGEKLSPLGFRSDRHFSPHVTLGRVKNYASIAELGIITQEIEANKALVLGDDCISEICLYQSTLQPGGSVYRLVHRAQLKNTMLH